MIPVLSLWRRSTSYRSPCPTTCAWRRGLRGTPFTSSRVCPPTPSRSGSSHTTTTFSDQTDLGLLLMRRTSRTETLSGRTLQSGLLSDLRTRDCPQEAGDASGTGTCVVWSRRCVWGVCNVSNVLFNSSAWTDLEFIHLYATDNRDLFSGYGRLHRKFQMFDKDILYRGMWGHLLFCFVFFKTGLQVRVHGRTLQQLISFVHYFTIPKIKNKKRWECLIDCKKKFPLEVLSKIMNSIACKVTIYLFV